MDLMSYSRWFDYSRARDEMFTASDTPYAPWHVAHSDHKRRMRLNLIAHLLSQIPYKKLPCRQGETAEEAEAEGVQGSGLPLQGHQGSVLNRRAVGPSDRLTETT
jgi:hypothetical protein